MISGETPTIGWLEQARRDQERAARDPEFAAQRAREAEEARQTLRAERRAEILKQAEEQLRTRRQEMLPARIARAFDAGLEETAPVRAARAHGASDRVVLVLGGPPGVGKSVAAASVMHRLRWARVDEETTIALPYLAGQFVHADDLAFADSYGREAREFWDEIETVGILVVDDLGARTPSDLFRANLSGLLCKRFDDHLETVLTTNLAQNIFQATFLAHDGGRVLDRFSEGGTFYWCKGPSLRGRVKESR